jgi:hypothetical protein
MLKRHHFIIVHARKLMMPPTTLINPNPTGPFAHDIASSSLLSATRIESATQPTLSQWQIFLVPRHPFHDHGRRGLDSLMMRHSHEKSPPLSNGAWHVTCEVLGIGTWPCLAIPLYLCQNSTFPPHWFGNESYVGSSDRHDVVGHWLWIIGAKPFAIESVDQPIS